MPSLKQFRTSGWLARARALALATIGASCLMAGSASATDVDFWTLFTGPDGAAIDQLVK